MGRHPDQLLIAEVKTRSPFGWEAAESWQERFEIANEYGDWVAVHTEEPWGGSLELLEKARGLTDKPLLAKGIHDSDEAIERAVAAGADYVLAVGRIPKVHADKYIIEPRNVYDLRCTALAGLRIVWNSRNLESGDAKIDPTTGEPVPFAEMRKIRPDNWLCQASFIETAGDVDPSADAVLVGTHLPEFVKSL